MIGIALQLLRSPLAGWLVGALAALVIYGVQGYRLAGVMQTVAELQAQNTELQAAIHKQNDHISSLEQAARYREASAGERALRVLNDGERRRRELPAGRGPEVMNQWLTDTFR